MAKKERYTTYVHPRHRELLERISRERGVSVVSLLGNAIDDLLIATGWEHAPLAPPISHDYLRHDQEMDR